MMKHHIVTPLLLTLALALPVAAQLVPAAKVTGVIAPQKAATLEFQYTAAGISKEALAETSAGGFAYVVSDYAGAKVAQGKAPFANNTVTLTLTLPPGYYDVTFPVLKQTFGLISLATLKGQKDPFFCLDAELSWLAPEQQSADPPDDRPRARRQRLMTLMQQLSVDIARERLIWHDLNTGVGKFNWEGSLRFDSLRKRYALVGLGVLEAFDDTPEYLLHPTPSRTPYPADLVATSQAWAAIANRWKDAHAGIEVWSEPDARAYYGNLLPADQYVPMVKAVSRGLSSAKIHTPVGGGALGSLDNAAFLRGLSGGGLLRAVDFVSFHNNDGGGESVREQVAACRKWLTQAGADGMEIWITQSGKSWPLKPGERPTAAEEAASALSIVAKAIEARACGVERYFPFSLPPSPDDKRVFAMTDNDGLPLRPLAAYGACIATLTNRAYVGDLALVTKWTREPLVERAPVFADNATAVVAIYCDSVKPGQNKSGPVMCDWDLELPILHVLGIDGRELKPVTDGGRTQIPLDDGVAYVFVSVREVDKHLRVDTEAMRLTRLARQVHTRQPLPPIVLQHLPDFASVQTSSHGYKITKGDAKNWPIAIRVNNFSYEEELTLTVRAYAGATAATAASAKPLAAKTVTLEAGKNADLTLPIDLTQTDNEVLITIGDDHNELDRLLIQFVKP